MNYLAILFIAASQLIANLSMKDCPFVLMILISFFNASNDLYFEDPYLIMSIQYQFKSMLWRYLCSSMNKHSAVQKMEDYMHLVKLMNNVDEVLKKTESDNTTIETPPGEVSTAKDSSISGRNTHTDSY